MHAIHNELQDAYGIEPCLKKCTATDFGHVLAHNGGINNAMIQVLRTDTVTSTAIECKFELVVKEFQKYFARINHAYFSVPRLVGGDLGQTLDLSYLGLDIIDEMIFDIGVQSFSNINRIVNFHVDMTKPKSQKIQPD